MCKVRGLNAVSSDARGIAFQHAWCLWQVLSPGGLATAPRQPHRVMDISEVRQSKTKNKHFAWENDLLVQ